MGSEHRTWARLAAVVLALAAGGAACGGFVESGGSISRLTVGPEGGRLTYDTFALGVPPQAVGSTVTLSAQRAASDAPAGPAFVVGPDHVTFPMAAPAEVELAYDAISYPHPFFFFFFFFSSGGWQPLSASPTDPGAPG